MNHGYYFMNPRKIIETPLEMLSNGAGEKSYG